MRKATTPDTSSATVTQVVRIPKGMLDDFKWLNRAMAKDKTRVTLMMFHVEDADTVVTTDGRRLHMLTRQAHGIPPGDYRIVSRSPMIIEADPVSSYPNWRQAIPSNEKAKAYTAGDKHMAAALFGKEGGCLNLDYIADAFMGKEMTMVVVDSNYPVVLKDATHTAVIMPMRLP